MQGRRGATKSTFHKRKPRHNSSSSNKLLKCHLLQFRTHSVTHSFGVIWVVDGLLFWVRVGAFGSSKETPIWILLMWWWKHHWSGVWARRSHLGCPFVLYLKYFILFVIQIESAHCPRERTVCGWQLIPFPALDHVPLALSEWQARGNGLLNISRFYGNNEEESSIKTA